MTFSEISLTAVCSHLPYGEQKKKKNIETNVTSRIWTSSFCYSLLHDKV